MNRSKIIALFLILCALISFSIVYVILGYYMNGHWGNSYKERPYRSSCSEGTSFRHVSR